jgi:hypothetical protein
MQGCGAYGSEAMRRMFDWQRKKFGVFILGSCKGVVRIHLLGLGGWNDVISIFLYLYMSIIGSQAISRIFDWQRNMSCVFTLGSL